MRFEGPHCHQPTRFGPHPTPPVSPTFARKATAHGSLVTPHHFLFGVIIKDSRVSWATTYLMKTVDGL
jgi:hypothetical protein